MKRCPCRSSIVTALAGLAFAGCSGGGGDGGDDDGGAGAADAARSDGGEAPPVDAALSPDAALPAGRVIPIYVTAVDESDADIAAHVAIYDAILEGIRGWYTEHLPGDDQLAFHAEPVRPLRGHYTRAQWDFFGTQGFIYPDGTTTEPGGGCSMYYGTLHELTEGGLLAEAGLPPPGTPDVLYYAIAGGGTNGSCGAGGYLGASELQLLTLAAANCETGRLVGAATDCAPVGAVAHELGHGFGLPHGSDRPVCTDGPTLMDVWWQYDDGARLCLEDQSDLRASSFFAPI
jgi:hypothetical protein